MLPRPGAARTRRTGRLRVERCGARRRLMLLGAIAAVAIVAAACLPPPPPPPPPTTTTTTTKPPPPPAICGFTSQSGGTAAVSSGDTGATITNQYAAIVEAPDGDAEVLTRTVNSPAEIEQFRTDAATQGEVLSFAPDGEVHAMTETPTWGFLDGKFTDAWEVPTATTGSGVRVAELDTGIDTQHAELVGHFDLEPGADIVTASLVSPPLDPPPAATTDPSTSGHGTHVAGIIAATTGNNLGVEGGAPGVTLVPVRVLEASGSGTFADVAAGILWAADVSKGNAQVITMSLAGNTNQLVIDAIETVSDLADPDYTHPVITAAAGNSSCSSTRFPASLGSDHPHVLAVSALCKSGVTGSCPTATPWPADDAYKLATYSSLAWNGSGTPSGITAPGTDIDSTLPGDSFGPKSGTSMATPFAAAAAALVVAHCPLSASYTAGDVVDRLEESARNLGPAGPDELYGYGMLDAVAAVQSC